jgi:hypothetical protein
MAEVDFDPHDATSVRNRFEQLIRDAHQTGDLDSVADFAVQYGRDATYLVRAVRDRMERKTDAPEPKSKLNRRLMLLRVVDAICIKEKNADKHAFADELVAVIEGLVSAVLNAVALDKLEKALWAPFDDMLVKVETFLQTWKSKKIFEDSLVDRMLNQRTIVKGELDQKKLEGDPSIKRILKTMEDDRDKVCLFHLLRSLGVVLTFC